MELILVVGTAMIMALISLISMLLQTDMIKNNQIKRQWYEHNFPAREKMRADVRPAHDLIIRNKVNR